MDVFARVLSRVYTPSITHPGLRNMIIALLLSSSGSQNSRYPTLLEQRHVDITIGTLTQKLSNPSEIDEGDIFVSYLLAVWYINIDPTAIDIHVQGLFAIMRHLSQNVEFTTSPMSPFWALLRDEILWLTRRSNNCRRICRDFRDILGPKTIQQRQTYENELRTAAQFRHPNAKVFYGRNMYTSVHTLMDSARILDQHDLSTHDPLIESVLVELHVEHRLVKEKRHEDFLESEIAPLQKGQYVKDHHVELTVIERLHDLIVLHVCRLTTIALEATSIQQGLYSAEAMIEATSLLSVLRRASAFILAGIQGNRVFGTG